MGLGIKIPSEKWDSYQVTIGEKYELVFVSPALVSEDRIAQLMSNMKASCDAGQGYLYPDKIDVKTLTVSGPGSVPPGPEMPTELNVESKEYEIHVTGKIVKNPIVLMGLAQWVFTLAVSLLIYLSLRYVYLIGGGESKEGSESVGGKINMILLIALLVAIGFLTRELKG
jgi:hypothetical protein